MLHHTGQQFKRLQLAKDIMSHANNYDNDYIVALGFLK